MRIDPDKSYTAREAAALLGVTEETVKNYCRASKLPAKRIGPKGRWSVQGDAIINKRKEWQLDDDGS